MPLLEDLTGRKFGRLTVISRAPNGASTSPRWHCVCECGNALVTYGGSLRIGRTKTCGCGFHRMTYSPTWTSWNAMKRRCNNPRNNKFHLYGGRGIKVCKRWKEFRNFLADMGVRPSLRHTLDRIDSNGNYEPGNCRWAETSEQNANRRHYGKRFDHNGEQLTITEWSERTGIKEETLRQRIKSGLSISQAINIKVANTGKLSKRICEMSPSGNRGKAAIA